MKLAYFSPFNPQPSGISDYSEELLPYLAAHADIDLFVDGFQPSNQEMLARFDWFDYRANPESLKRLPQYDAIIYHLGNDHRYHTGIVRVMRDYPGVVVFHDFALQDFFLGQAREQANMSSYLDELEVCHGPRERAQAEEYLRRGATPPHAAAPLTFSLNARLARAAEGIVVHSRWGREQFARIAPNVPVAQIPMPVPPPRLAEPPAAERNNKLLNIASFGLITPGKGIERTLRALSGLRDEFDFHYTLVGAENSHFDVRAIIKSYGMTDRVTITGHLPLEEFERWILKTDIAVNLRERTVGETSASLCRIMAAGVPAIVSNVGAFAELPNNAVVKIDQDEFADPLLHAFLRRLIEDRGLRLLIGQHAHRHVLAEHRIEASAAAYLEFIREVIARRPRRHLVNDIANELSMLGVQSNHDSFLRGVAAELAVLTPETATGDITDRRRADAATFVPSPTAGEGDDNGHRATAAAQSPGRLPKLEGVDYKLSAIEYLGKLSEERSHHLRTKPFYNLAHKPAKYKGEGMDEDTHRHFCDFANMAVTLALPVGAKILDVGCGSGWLSEYFARLGYQVKGLDISPDLIAMSRDRVARVPFGVDHETPLRCDFVVHDVELAPLVEEKFDAIICYDSLHHFEDERAVMRNLAAMLDPGGFLFILEGEKPDDDSSTADELRNVMHEFGTLESPFGNEYLRTLVSEHGLAIVGNYVSVNGLFEREMLEGGGANQKLPLRTIATNYHYLTCMKVVEAGRATDIPDSRNPGVVRADFALLVQDPLRVEPEREFVVPVTITNAGDTLWLTGQTVRAGMVMPGVRIIDESGQIVSERQGHPMLTRAVLPGQTIALDVECVAPEKPGNYRVKIDLVAQHVCWFEERGSQPLVLSLDVENE